LLSPPGSTLLPYTTLFRSVCMANGGGGTVVFGVADRVKGRGRAILGVPPEIDTNILKAAVYDQTDPKIMPVFEELPVSEGTGRLDRKSTRLNSSHVKISYA